MFFSVSSGYVRHNEDRDNFFTGKKINQLAEKRVRMQYIVSGVRSSAGMCDVIACTSIISLAPTTMSSISMFTAPVVRITTGIIF